MGNVRRVLELGEPLLREPALIVHASEFGTSALQSVVDDLIATMKDKNGGIAATQVGINKRVFVVHVEGNPRYPYKPKFPLSVFINPQISVVDSTDISVIEGCLSVPGIRGRVFRKAAVEVTAQRVDGTQFSLYAEGLSAGTLQHENDHLDGLLFVDKVNSVSDLMTWEGFNRAHKETFFKEAEDINQKYPQNVVFQ